MLIAATTDDYIRRTDKAIQSLPGDPIFWGQLCHGAKAVKWNELAHRVFIWHGGRHIDIYDDQAIFIARATRPEPYTLSHFIKLASDHQA